VGKKRVFVLYRREAVSKRSVGVTYLGARTKKEKVSCYMRETSGVFQSGGRRGRRWTTIRTEMRRLRTSGHYGGLHTRERRRENLNRVALNNRRTGVPRNSEGGAACKGKERTKVLEKGKHSEGSQSKETA